MRSWLSTDWLAPLPIYMDLLGLSSLSPLSSPPKMSGGKIKPVWIAVRIQKRDVQWLGSGGLWVPTAVRITIIVLFAL